MPNHSLQAVLLPRLRKRKLREDALYEERWFRISSDMWREPGEFPRKLKVIADTNFPLPLVRLMQRKKSNVKTAQSLGLDKLSESTHRGNQCFLVHDAPANRKMLERRGAGAPRKTIKATGLCLNKAHNQIRAPNRVSARHVYQTKSFDTRTRAVLC
jgi:hypothetical protein